MIRKGADTHQQQTKVRTPINSKLSVMMGVLNYVLVRYLSAEK